MDIRKIKNNFDKDGKPRYFNCNKYGYIAKEYRRPKEKDMKKCYKCKQVGYIAKNCKLGQKIKTQSVQEESDEKDQEREQSFRKGPK